MKKFPLTLVLVYLLSTSFYTSKAVKEDAIKKEKIELISLSPSEKTKSTRIATTDELYKSIIFDAESSLSFDVFDKAYQGFQNLKKAGKLEDNAHLLSICDFSLSSNKKRLWVIDLNEKKVLFNSLVAHGKGTGEEFATAFSNIESSHQSSLGFYVTETTYNGSNGYSLKLIGMDKGYNDAAMQRAIVMHGADYVSEDFIKSEKRLGRSWGCPAVPRTLAEPIINTIKDKTLLFIYYPDQQYLSQSEWLKPANQDNESLHLASK